MGIIVSVLVGIALTLPISSAAICHAITIAGLAGGAAVAGCCAQMVGFAVMSFRENRWGRPGVPRHWYLHAPDGQYCEKPPDLDSAHPHLSHHRPPGHMPVPSGDEWRCCGRCMGTCGFVGQIGVYTGWVRDMEAGVKAAITSWDLGGTDPHLLRAARCDLPAARASLAKTRLDQGRGSETRLIAEIGREEECILLYSIQRNPQEFFEIFE